MNNPQQQQQNFLEFSIRNQKKKQLVMIEIANFNEEKKNLQETSKHPFSD
jgi:hypothetical protein